MTAPPAAEAVTRHFASRAAGYGRRSERGAWRALRARELAVVTDHVAPHPCDEILDVGTGAGFYLASLRARVARAEGVDVCPEMVAASRGRGFDVAQARIEDVPGCARFDKIVAAGVLEFVADHDSFLAAARRLVRPAGRLVVLLPRRSAGGALYGLYHALHGIRIRNPRQDAFEATARRAGWRAGRTSPAATVLSRVLSLEANG